MFSDLGVLYCGFTDVLWFLRAVFYACSLMFSAFRVLFDLWSFFYWYCRLREFSEVLRFLGAVYVLFFLLLVLSSMKVH